MKKESKEVLSLGLRYLILVLIAIPGFDLFYYLFTPLTQIPVFTLLGSLFETSIVGGSIFIGEKSIEIVGACIAGSAYYLLLILNLATPKIKFGERMKMLLMGFGIFLFINISRIFLLSIMYVNDSPLFTFAHKLFWYIGSTIFVVAIWFLQVKIFKVHAIPFYTDLKKIYSQSSLKK